MNLPPIVSETEWQAARDRFLVIEKAATRASDELATERRNLPMVEISKQYEFDGPGGRTNLVGLFDGRRQLIVYHFMFGPGCEEGCERCSFLVDNIAHISHLHARDTSLVLVSRAPLTELAPFKERMGWDIAWFSSFGSDFNFDFELSTEENETFGLSVFLREGDRIFRSYFTAGRGVDALLNTYGFLDLTPLGRQEDWETSPAGWPQTTDGWVRHHDRYGR